MNTSPPVPTVTPSLHSAVNCCRLAGVVPDRLAQVVELLGITPAMRINGTAHYAEADLQQVITYLRHRSNRTQQRPSESPQRLARPNSV